MRAGRTSSRARPAPENTRSGPVAIERPVTETELVAIVKQAAASGLRIRAVGGGHSRAAPPGPEQPGATDGIVINLSGYGRMLRVDRDHGWATVQSGRPMLNLHRGLGARGLALANGPDDLSQSIGSAVSAGAHGTGAHLPGLAAEVEGLELVTARGELLACSAQQAADVFAAARVGLGALGVISTVTLRCQPAYNLRPETGFARIDDLLAFFDEHADGNDLFQFSWIPGTRWARTFRAQRTEESTGADRAYRVFPSHQPRWRMVEYSLPRAELMSAVGQLRARIGNRTWAAPFPIRVRTTAGDDIALSTATGRPSAYVAVPVGPLAHLLDSLGGRPQWTGPHGATAAALRERYPRWDEWQAVRQRLDPDRRFANAFTEAVLGL